MWLFKREISNCVREAKIKNNLITLSISDSSWAESIRRILDSTRSAAMHEGEPLPFVYSQKENQILITANNVRDLEGIVNLLLKDRIISLAKANDLKKDFPMDNKTKELVQNSPTFRGCTTN